MNANDLRIHVNDPARLAALRAVALLDTPTEEAFDRLSRLAVRFVEAPVALVSLIDADRQFFKSCIGLPEPYHSRRETPLSHSFCQHNRIPERPLLIEDAREHPLFQDNPAIADLHVVAYLGIPLTTSDGYVLGSFCVIDGKPRRWRDDEVAVVRDLAEAVMTEIHLRTEIKGRKTAETERNDLAELNRVLHEEIAARRQAEDQLQHMKDELERRVEERTRELQETQAQYMHAARLSAVGRLSASIAHELNNPLQGLMTILHGFKKDTMPGGRDQGMLELAIGEVKRMRDLIRSLQEYNRPSSGRKAFMDVHATLDSILLFCRSEFQAKNILIERQYAHNLPHIRAVPDQIKQVFFNLLNNAANAIVDSGVITIRTWREGGCVGIVVEDTGVGIDPDKLGLIFQPFYTTKPAVKGTGLGLSVCHGIVDSHGGKIQVESQPNRGAIFTVLLPIDTGEEM